jgi:hypothetical protein
MAPIKQKPVRHDDDDGEWGGGGIDGIVTLPFGGNLKYV